MEQGSIPSVPDPRFPENLTETEEALIVYLLGTTEIAEIARILSKSVNTIKTQVSSVYRKLRVTRRHDVRANYNAYKAERLREAQLRQLTDAMLPVYLPPALEELLTFSRPFSAEQVYRLMLQVADPDGQLNGILTLLPQWMKPLGAISATHCILAGFRALGIIYDEDHFVLVADDLAAARELAVQLLSGAAASAGELVQLQQTQTAVVSAATDLALAADAVRLRVARLLPVSV